VSYLKGFRHVCMAHFSRKKLISADMRWRSIEIQEEKKSHLNTVVREA
jgi:hypothetical protein